MVALERFLASATDSDPLRPANGAERTVTWGEARRALYERARATGLQQRRAARRNPKTFSRRAERQYLSTLMPLPETGPLVSIILATFNRESTLERAVASVRAQGYRDWELIVVDDGSTDGTPDVVAQLLGADPRIRSIRLDDNGGVSAARNAGLSVAQGGLIAFLDSDNRWRPSFLAVSVAAIAASGAVAVYSAAELHLDGGEREYLGAPSTRDDLLEGRNQVDLSALVVTRAALDEAGAFDEGLRRWVDYGLVLRIAQRHELLFLPVLGLDYDHRNSSGDRITTTESPLWRSVVLEKNLVDWDRLRAAAPDREHGRVSVIVPVDGDWREALETVETALRDAEGESEVVVLDNGSPRHVSAILTAAFLGERRVTVHRVAGGLAPATCVNVAFALTTGATVVVMGPGGPQFTGTAREIASRSGFDPFQDGAELELRRASG
jgi:GT2 family glycosyltransferase